MAAPDDTTTALTEVPQPAQRPGWPTRFAAGVATAARGVARGAKFAWTERLRAVGAVNGVAGDTLARLRSPLALKMTLLDHDGAAIIDARGARGALPASTRRVCVFVHGLGDCERTWRHAEVAHGAAVQASCGYTPLYLRYNSGLHISHNGRAFASALEHLVEAHGDVDEIALVGHSMGGLVIRSACHYGADARWVSRLRSVVFVGTPHDGAHLERAGQLATVVLSLVPNPTTRLIAQIASLRSAGTRDLRHGYLLDEEWSGAGGVLSRLLPMGRRNVPKVPGVDYFAAAATLAANPERLSARAFGDGLVHPSSALGQRWYGPGLDLPEDNTRIFARTSHAGLLTSAEVRDQIADWLARAAGGRS